MNEVYDQSRNNIIESVNEILSKGIIVFLKPNPNSKQNFTTYSFDILVKHYELKNEKDLCYAVKVNGSYTYKYSKKMIDRIVVIISNNPNCVIEIKKLTPGA